MPPIATAAFSAVTGVMLVALGMVRAAAANAINKSSAIAATDSETAARTVSFDALAGLALARVVVDDWRAIMLLMFCAKASPTSEV